MKLNTFYSLQAFALAFILGACASEPTILYRTEYIPPDPPPAELLTIEQKPAGKPAAPAYPDGSLKLKDGKPVDWTDDEIQIWWRQAIDWGARLEAWADENCIRLRGLAILFGKIPGDVCGLP